MAVIGKQNELRVVREAPQGVYLDGEELGEILLPAGMVPRDATIDTMIDVFVHRDSEDRLVATTETPVAMAGEFALLRVVGIHPSVGAFLDWGLRKDLLLPFREMETPVTDGEWLVVFIHLDTRTDRIYATTRLSRHLSPEPPAYTTGQPVDLIITRETPLGYIALVEKSHLGLLYHSQVPRTLRIGEQVKGYTGAPRTDGKIDLTLESSGRHAVASLSERILEALEKNGGNLPLDDDSPPEAIRKAFDASKKAFKQAIGQLYREQRIRLTKPGIALAR